MTDVERRQDASAEYVKGWNDGIAARKELDDLSAMERAFAAHRQAALSAIDPPSADEVRFKAAGIEPDMSLPALPEVSRLRREVATLKGRTDDHTG